MKYASISVITALALALTVTSTIANPVEDQTEAVFDHHVGEFLAGDLDGIMEDYTDTSVVSLSQTIVGVGVNGEDLEVEQTFTGLVEIRALFASLLADFGVVLNGDSTFIPDSVNITGRNVRVHWHAETPNNVYNSGFDKIQILNNKIKKQTVDIVVTPK